MVALLLSCDEDLESLVIPDDASVTSLNGTWRVMAYQDYRQGGMITQTEENSWGRDVVITFDDTTDPFSISGQNTTNSVFGSFSYSSRRSILVPALGSTKVGQPEWGNLFTRIMRDELTFRINSSRLRLHNESEELATFLEKQ
jgi:hypothetical protein